MKSKRFPLGRLLATPGALRACEDSGVNPLNLIDRHWSGDWGDLPEEDKKENEFAVDKQLRILSAYVIALDVKIWIITEADRSATTILLPENIREICEIRIKASAQKSRGFFICAITRLTPATQGLAPLQRILVLCKKQRECFH